MMLWMCVYCIAPTLHPQNTFRHWDFEKFIRCGRVGNAKCNADYNAVSSLAHITALYLITWDLSAHPFYQVNVTQRSTDRTLEIRTWHTYQSNTHSVDMDSHFRWINNVKFYAENDNHVDCRMYLALEMCKYHMYSQNSYFNLAVWV